MSVTLGLLLLPGCSDDSLPGDPNSPASGTPPIHFLSFRSDTAVPEDATIELRWTTDSLASPNKRIVIYVKDAALPGLRVYRQVERTLKSVDVSLVDFTESRLRFMIGFEGEARCDSTGSIERTAIQLEILSPQFRMPFLRSEPNLFYWKCSPMMTGRRVFIDCAKQDGSWQSFTSALVELDSIRLTTLPFTDITWVRFRFRLEQSSREVVVDSVPQLLFRIKNVSAGQGIERGKEFKIKLESGTPQVNNTTTESVLSLSTDDGATWETIPATWFVTQPASSRCYLRYANAYFNVERVVGPFSIVDNTTPFFQPIVGMHLKYMCVNSYSSGGATVPEDSTYLTIDVESTVVYSDRTEYHCTLTSEKNGSSTSRPGILTQRHDGLQEVVGDFRPYNEFPIPGIYPRDIDIYRNNKTIGTPGTIGMQSRWVNAERGRGITTFSEGTVTGIISRSGYGTTYTLM
ncbi:MAG: hypothetical protein WBQ23_02150 [Bacteroidota bacterium]